MDREILLDRLDSLVGLCEKSEPDYNDSNILFTGQFIVAQEMQAKLSRIVLEDIDDKSQASIGAREEIVDIMKEANTIWKMRKKMMRWKDEGRNLTTEALDMEGEIEDSLMKGMKINAIKIYRAGMKDIFDVNASLRESKEYIDQIHKELQKRGLIKK